MNTQTEILETTKKILIVDDDSAFRDNVCQLLLLQSDMSDYIDIDQAVFCDQAEEFFTNNEYDLLLLDVNLPDGDGFSLLQKINALPNPPKVILMSAYDLSRYYHLFRQNNVHHFMAKVLPFDYHCLKSTVLGVLFPHRYGKMHHFLENGTATTKFAIRGTNDVAAAIEKLTLFILSFGIESFNFLPIALTEALTNAVYHAKRNKEGEKVYQKGSVITELAQDEWVELEYGADNDRLVIAIRDQGGSMLPDSVLAYFEKNSNVETSLSDPSGGRGLYIIHQFVDYMIANIVPGELTELLLIQFLNAEEGRKSQKPFMLNVVS